MIHGKCLSFGFEGVPMRYATSVVSRRGQATIPAEIRGALGL
jgi:hypothetical protein